MLSPGRAAPASRARCSSATTPPRRSPSAASCRSRDEPPRRTYLRQLAGRRPRARVSSARAGRQRRAHGPRLHARVRRLRTARRHPTTTPPATAFDKAGRCSACPSRADRTSRKRRRMAGRARLKLPRAWMHGTFDFSFSGLKTAVLPHRSEGWLRRPDDRLGVPGGGGRRARREDIPSGARARRGGSPDRGGVAANKRLREELQRRCPVPVRIPPAKYCTDNAA